MTTMTSSIHVESLQAWFMALAQKAALIEFMALAICMGLAWFFTSLLRRVVGTWDDRSILFGRKILDGVMFPVLLL